MKPSFLFLLFFLGITSITAQNGFSAHPSFIKWKNIDTKNIKVIFPEGLESQANRIANIIDLITAKHSNSIGFKTKKIDLVLQTNQIFSNGFAGLSPIKTEFFGTPFQNNTFLGSTDWLDTLSIHEFRHLQQFLNGRRGFTKWMSYLQGQQGWSLALNLSIPDWFFEGDATMTETVLSNNGRGRTPSFFSEQRALLLDNVDYSYHKARNRSFKDLVPDHYRLGYTIMNYSRNNFGSTIWKDVLADAGRYSTVFYPFSGALKKHTGFRVPKLYKKSYATLKQNWLTELDRITLTATQRITKQNKRTVTNYRNAHYLNDGSIIAVKSSYKETPYLVHLTNNKETKLTNIGIEPEGFISENNNQIAWTEVKTDVRWANRSYSVIKAFNFNTKKKRTITTNGKFFSPQFSTKGNQIAVVESNEKLKTSILILDSNTGNQDQRIEIKTNDFVSFPKWTSNDKALVYLLKRNSELAFFKYEFSNKKTTQLIDWTTNSIGNYTISNSRIYFNAGYSGIDNIYSVNLDGTKKITQITSVKIGVYTPDISPDNSKLLVSELSKMGNNLSELKLEKSLNKQVTPIPAMQMERYQIRLSNTEKNILDSIPNVSHKIKNYNGFLKGTKLHSWGIISNSSETSFNFQFDNILSDFSASLNLGYNYNEETTTYGGSVFYGKYFPILSLSTSLQSRATKQQISSQLGVLNFLPFLTHRFDERIFSGGIQTPLNWITGNYRTSLRPSINYQYYTITSSNLRDNYSFGNLSTRLRFTNFRRKAFQNIAPRWSQSIDLSYQKSVNTNIAENIRGLVSLNFPGVLKNHSLNIQGEYQKERLSNRYQFIDQFQYARGYNSLYGDRAQRISFNYRLPLAYPDWGFGGITYFKRIKVNLFYDISQTKLNFNNTTVNANSYGFEILFDNTYFNVLPVTLGIRNSWRTASFVSNDSPVVEFFFGTSF